MKPRFYAVSYNSYKSPGNISASVAANIVGVRDWKENYLHGFKSLRPGDIILLRETSGSTAHSPKFVQHCHVVGQPYVDRRQRLWPDEGRDKKILYPHRIRVSFSDAPELLGLYVHGWAEWFGLGWTTTKGEPVTTIRRLAPQLNGRYLPPGTNSDVWTADLQAKYDAFTAFLLAGTRQEKKKRKADRRTETGIAGERVIYERLVAKYRETAVKVEWTASRTPSSPFDICVIEPGRPIRYVEVKSTTRPTSPACGVISSGEWSIREQDPEQYDLYFVVFDRSLEDPNPRIYRITDDIRGDVSAWQLRLNLNACAPVTDL